jgi:NTE family protein
MQNVKHLLASTGYPQYGFPWVQVEDKVFAWGGALLSNSPIRAVLVASPRENKHLSMVENYLRKIDKLPSTVKG